MVPGEGDPPLHGPGPRVGRGLAGSSPAPGKTGS